MHYCLEADRNWFVKGFPVEHVSVLVVQALPPSLKGRGQKSWATLVLPYVGMFDVLFTVYIVVLGLRHQLRVHLADSLQCPVLGDHKFGGRLLRLDPTLTRKVKIMDVEKGHLYLHAKEVELAGYYGNNKPLVIQAKLPDHFETAIEKLGLKPNKL